MKTINKVLVALTLVVGGILLALPANSVSAQSEDPPRVETQLPRGSRGLEELFEEEVERYERAGERIANIVNKSYG